MFLPYFKRIWAVRNRKKNDQAIIYGGLDIRFLDAIYIVEATKFETERLRQDFADVLEWEDVAETTAQVGTVYGWPITLTFSWKRLNNIVVVFWERHSSLYDHNVVLVWFEKNLPYTPKCQAETFSICMRGIVAEQDNKIMKELT